MKNLTILFVLALLTSTVQSQSLTEKEIIATWQVVNVVETGSQPKLATEMIAAYFNFYSDHSFQLRIKKDNTSPKGYEDKYSNNTWTYNEATQTIELSKGDMSIKTSKSDGKIFFELPESGIKLEVVMPI